jgi:hypothetical protein
VAAMDEQPRGRAVSLKVVNEPRTGAASAGGSSASDPLADDPFAEVEL